MQQVDLLYSPGAVSPVICVSQMDSGRQFKLIIYNEDGSPYTPPAGTTASIDGIKPDKKAFSYTDNISISGNVVTITTKLQMTCVKGTVVCEVRFKNGTTNIGTLNFNMIVEPSPINEDADISETELPAIIELATEEAQAAIEAAARSDANAILAESYAKGGTNTRTGEDTDNAKYYKEQADSQAEAAASSAADAADSAEDAEAWAVGERGGVPVGSLDETYENNSKYYANEADDSASNAFASEQNAKLSEQNAKASENILQYYVTFVIPHFVIANNRLYISNASHGEFTVANNRLYIKDAV